MPLIELYRNIKFMVNFNDHNPPHFHIWNTGNGYKATFLISDCSLLAGDTPDKLTRRVVKEWWIDNQDRLNQAWRDYCE